MLLACVAGVWILIASVGSGPVLAMQRVILESVSDRVAESFLARVIAKKVIELQWLSMCGFEPYSAYRVIQMPGDEGLVVWKKNGERTYLSAYLLTNGEMGVDIVTICNTGILTTGKSKDSQLLPSAPGNYLQSFTATMAVIYRRHQEAMEVLARTTHMMPLISDGAFEDDFAAAMHQHSEYIRSLTIWPLRIPWWYFVRRFQRHDKTIMEFKKSKIR